MIDPINPWLDADELKQLAASLMQGSGQPKGPISQDAGFGESFVGFAATGSYLSPTPDQSLSPTVPPTVIPSTAEKDASPLPAITSPPAAPTPVSQVAPIISAPVAPAIPISSSSSPAPESINPPATSDPELQCRQFQTDMQRQFGSSDLFILNRDGHTVFGKETHPQFQFIARSLTKHAERRGLPKGHIHIKVGPSQTLEIIPVDLPNGGWVVGTLVPNPLQPAEIAHWVREISKLGSTLNQL